MTVAILLISVGNVSFRNDLLLAASTD